jgi:peptide/nickel transport system permease protein
MAYAAVSAFSAPKILRRVRPFKNPKTLLGGSVFVALILIGLLAPLISPFDPNLQDLESAMIAPQWFSGSHILGTDPLGRDVLSRLIYGARVSLIISVAVALFSGMIGVTLGAISGFYSGLIDLLIQKCVEVMWAFPPLLFAIALIAFVGQSLPVLIIALVLQRWIPFCRVARAQALSLRSRDFIESARALGATNLRILRQHIIPNLLQNALVVGTFAMATAIISEASLSFLGLGVPLDIPTWGSMLADARSHISTSWWLPLFPGLFILVTVLSINLLGDGLRDILDPKLNYTGNGSRHR